MVIYSKKIKIFFFEMNVEILCHKIFCNQSHTFEFSKVVQRYLVGFSKCRLNYREGTDHHVKEITIDLTDSNNEGRKVIVTPKLMLRDDSHNKEHATSFIEVVVIAIVGTGNNDVQILTGIQEDDDCQLTSEKITFLCSSLLSLNTYYKYSDHHVHRFYSYVRPSTKDKNFKLLGTTTMLDFKQHRGEGSTSGNVIAYFGKNRNIMCQEFEYRKNGRQSFLNFGKAPSNFNPQNYVFGCFIKEFSFFFEPRRGHHIEYFTISSSILENKIYKKNGNIMADLLLHGRISDRHDKGSNVEENDFSGFVILIDKSII